MWTFVLFQIYETVSITEHHVNVFILMQKENVFLDEFDETISAVIVSVYSAEKGLFYAIDKRKFDIFLGIESYTPRNRNEFKTVPAFHELFLYVNEEGKTFRAYRLLSNPAANGSIRFFLIDVGIRMYLNFTAKQFYAFPDEFDLNLIHPMALFCHLDDCSTGNLLKSEFLQLSLEKTVRLKVVREIKVQNDLGPGRFCLGVVAVNASELLNDGISLHESDENDSQDDYLDLTLVENEDSAVYVPVESHLISQAHDVPIPGSMVLVYEAHVETENTLWACIRTQDSISQEISTKAMDMHTSMNVDSYKKLKEPPRAGDMVIAFGADDRFHRGYVVNTINSKNIVSFSLLLKHLN